MDCREIVDAVFEAWACVPCVHRNEEGIPDTCRKTNHPCLFGECPELPESVMVVYDRLCSTVCQEAKSGL